MYRRAYSRTHSDNAPIRPLPSLLSNLSPQKVSDDGQQGPDVPRLDADAHGGLRAESAERVREGGDPMPAHERPGDRRRQGLPDGAR